MIITILITLLVGVVIGTLVLLNTKNKRIAFLEKRYLEEHDSAIYNKAFNTELRDKLDISIKDNLAKDKEIEHLNRLLNASKDKPAEAPLVNTPVKQLMGQKESYTARRARNHDTIQIMKTLLEALDCVVFDNAHNELNGKSTFLKIGRGRKFTYFGFAEVPYRWYIGSEHSGVIRHGTENTFTPTDIINELR